MISELYFSMNDDVFSNLRLAPHPAKSYISRIRSFFISTYLSRLDNLDDVIHMSQPKICEVYLLFHDAFYDGVKICIRKTEDELGRGLVHCNFNGFLTYLGANCDVNAYNYHEVNQRLMTISPNDKNKIGHTQHGYYGVEFMVIKELNKIDVYISEKPDFERDVSKALSKLRPSTRLDIIHKLGKEAVS